MSQGPLPGFRDFYPEQFAERAYIAGVWRDVARRFAFVEYDGPPLESLELYTKKSGDEIIGQLYNFTDKGDRGVALRPEMTPTLARMVAARANSLRKPIRWFSIPQLFRYERQQKGRLREHFQLNVDIVGEAGMSADAELLAVAIEVMRALGLGPKDVRARVSDRRLFAEIMVAAGVPRERVLDVAAVVDKIGRISTVEAYERLNTAGAQGQLAKEVFAIVTDLTVSDLKHYFGKSPPALAAIQMVEDLLETLDALGVSEWIDVDLRIVRGLAYYTGPVFELFDAQGDFRAICGGGRYDDLLEAIGGVSLPALGFGMGDVVLGELLRARGLMHAPAAGPDYWVASAEESLLTEVMKLATELRSKGRSVEYALRPQSLSKQLKAAASAGAREAVILREAGKDATVRNLADGAERNIPRQSLISNL